MTKTTSAICTAAVEMCDRHIAGCALCRASSTADTFPVGACETGMRLFERVETLVSVHHAPTQTGPGVAA